VSSPPPPAGGGARPAPRRTSVAARRRPAWERLPLLALGFAALAIGTGAGLARLGWPMPDLAAAAAAWHGPLMVCGFLGTVISLERAVAVGRGWAYAAPLASVAGTVALLHGGAALAPWIWLAAGIGLLAASLAVLRRQREGFTLTLAVAAAAWCIGTLAWARGGSVHDALGGWLSFLVLTIAGERLELSRYLPRPRWAGPAFGAIAAALLAATLAWPRPWAVQVFGAALLALAAWLAAFDIARLNVRQAGLIRFIAVCLLSGYVWLATAGAILTVAGAEPGSAARDAVLHALLLGFVFSMVFGHAPIIFPAVLRLTVPYRPRFFVPLALLHASLALRLAGDAAGWPHAVRWGALLSALALLAFVANTAIAAFGSRRRPLAAPTR
jgi:hypothetical protein